MLRLSTRPRRCKECPETFVPSFRYRVCCSDTCNAARALRKLEESRKRADRKAIAERRKAAAERKRETKAKILDLQPLSYFEKLAQDATNRLVRARDYYDGCISCGAMTTRSKRYTQGQWHAGHFRSVGENPELRFELSNIHKQCSRCNTQLSGNLLLYSQNLPKKIGQDKYAWLIGPHKPLKLDRQALQEMARQRNSQARQMEREIELIMEAA